MSPQALGGTRVSYKKAASVTLVANRFVKLASNTTITPVSGATDIPIGVLVELTARTDVPVAVQTDGIIDVEVGTGDVATRGPLKLTSTGCVTDSSTLAAGEVFVGTALETGAAGALIKVKLNPTAFATAT